MYHDEPVDIHGRQLWNLPTQRSSAPTPVSCTAFTLPSDGVISFASTAITLTTDVVFQPQCTGAQYNASDGDSAITKLGEPFYASTTPQIYVVAACTIIAWVLLIMLLITPRSAFMGNMSSSGGLGNGRGIIGGAHGGAGSSIIGVGSRPWLQKAAAFTVAVSLTIATADTFKVLQAQYNIGFVDAMALRESVLGSLEIRVTRVISDVFLWLAQVQTLIRLFPRHKEKVLIKWIGFVLIILDTIFSCLNSFMVRTQDRPRHFADAIPALSYLFELALGLLYAAWVIYYSLTKRQYAFYHTQMRSICVISLLSLVAVLTPVVFFVTDVSNPNLASWGDYFRWVGAAAASVVVWEWVERIEALERDEKKDGVLGREIFDGDEMLDVTPSEEVIWGRHGRNAAANNHRDPKFGDGGGQHAALESGLHIIANRFRHRHQPPRQHFPLGRAHSDITAQTSANGVSNTGNAAVAFGYMPTRGGDRPLNVLGGPTPPPPIASPISRADTTSAASTVYVVQYDPVADLPQMARRRVDAAANAAAARHSQQEQMRRQSMVISTLSEKGVVEEEDEDGRPNDDRVQKATGHSRWANVTNPFKRKRTSPPAEIQRAKEAASERRAKTPTHNFSRWDLKNRLGVMAADAGELVRGRRNPDPQPMIQSIPVTVVPAQPRGTGQTWSPDLHARHRAAAKSQEGAGTRTANSAETTGESGNSGSTTLTNNSTTQQPATIDDEQSRSDDVSPLGAGGVWTSPSSPVTFRGSSPQHTLAHDVSPSTTDGQEVPQFLAGRASSHSQTMPPRPGDLSPRTQRSVTIVSAPRRSPLRAATTASSDSDDVVRPNG